MLRVFLFSLCFCFLYALKAEEGASSNSQEAPSLLKPEISSTDSGFILDENKEPFFLELISPYTQVKKEEPFLLAVRIKIPPKWHSYWSFAGDFGQSPKIQWEQMEHVQIRPLPFPYPERKSFSLNQQVSYSFVYEKEILIPFEALIHKEYEGSFLPLTLHIQWFVCKELCLSKESQLFLQMGLAERFEENQESKKKIDFWKPYFPKKIKLKSYFQEKGKNLSLQFSFEEPIKCLDLFPSQKADFSTDRPLLLSQGDSSCSFQIAQSHLDLPKISGLLIYTHKGEKASVQFQSYHQKSLSLLWFLFLAFLGGLILNFMPCVLPIIFLKFYHTIELKSLSSKKILALNLSYVLGVLASFLSLAFIIFIAKQAGESLGWGFHLQSPLFVVFLTLLFTVMALYLLDILSFTGPKAALIFKEEKSFSHFLTGVLSTTAASPCTVPFMASAVGFAFSRSSLEIFLIFFFLGLGLSFPYLLLSVFPGGLKYLPSPGKWTETLKKLFSIPLFLTVLWLLWILHLQVNWMVFVFSLGLFPLLFCYLWLEKIFQKAIFKKLVVFAFLILFLAFFIGQKKLQNFTLKASSPPSSQKSALKDLNWSLFEENKILFDKQSGKKVFVAFGAEWCLTCKLNERIFKSEEFKKLAEEKDLTLYYGDWTMRNKSITDFLEKYVHQGVPFYIFFKGEEKTFIFPTLLFKESFLEELKNLSHEDS